MSEFVFFLLGFCTGALGTLIGTGGGFLLTPIFVFLFPYMSPARLTSLSLLAVAANSLSGSLGYARRQQVHWPSVWMFSVATVPGVFVGVAISQRLPRHAFELMFALFLLAISVYVLWRCGRPPLAVTTSADFWTRRARWIGGVISFFVGILSSLLGIGGGIVHVPLLSEYLRYPIHLAAGTSHAILALTSTVAVMDHWIHGDLRDLESFVPYLIVGLVLGAQVGAATSPRVSRSWLLRLLGVALVSVAVRLFWKNTVAL